MAESLLLVGGQADVIDVVLFDLGAMNFLVDFV
jgi:hypothetical protein